MRCQSIKNYYWRFGARYYCPTCLTGRLVQIIHYHSISNKKRASPPEVVIGGMKLPDLAPCSLPAKQKYHGTEESSAIGILRWGFDLTKTASGAKMAQAVYVSASDTVSASYGGDQLILSLDLRENEIASLSDDSLGDFKASVNKDFSNQKVMAAVRELFYQNGYRAIQYGLNHFGREEAWAIYDPTCISIEKINPAPVTSAPQASPILI